MREIIFRAWDDVRKKLVYDFSDYDFRNHTNDGESFRVICSGEDKNGDYYELELEQYTGLKDKNGKMIFEGDICSYYTPEYHDGNNFYKSKSETGVVSIDKRGVVFGGWQSVTPFGGCVSMYEIIGNIHDQKGDV